MKPETKQQIAQHGIEKFLRDPNKHSTAFLFVISLVAAGLVFFGLWDFLGLDILIALIPAVIIAAVGAPILRKLTDKEQTQANVTLDEFLRKHETRPGGGQKILQEITDQIIQQPVHETSSGSIITTDWYIDIHRSIIVKKTDIAAIVGMDGTYLLTTEGEKIAATFDEKQWGYTFNLFAASNPHLLSNDDEVEMPNGKTKRASTLLGREPQLIIDEYLRRLKQTADDQAAHGAPH